MPSVAAVTGLLFWAGYQTGAHLTVQHQQQSNAEQLNEALAEERRELDELRSEQRAHLDALALRVATLQARAMRVDALGERLVGMGKLSKDEFDFDAEPAMGGLDAAESGVSQSAFDISLDLQRLDSLLRDREDKLRLLEGQLANRELMHEALPSGKPVQKGWATSSYGYRTDPFTGKKTLHRGIDFAGKKGTEIYAVAGGVVKRSERGSGYGNLVEIQHADGYSTLYAHNKENLVKVGDVVTKGQLVALLGNTGRSSGPHVHFEVHKDGKVVNPRRYIRAP